MIDYAGHSVLITVTARPDSAYPGTLFVSLRRYDLNGDDPPAETVEVAAADDALEVLERWLRSVTL